MFLNVKLYKQAYHKSSFSNMAITQQADLEAHQIGIGVVAAGGGSEEGVGVGGEQRRRLVPEG